MKRIIIVGPCGAGKSTFARQLRDVLHLPLYSLDNIFWRKDKTHIEREEFDIKLEKILNEESWIIDGDYSRTYERRMEACDTIIYLSFPRDFCIEALKGRVGEVREDIPFVEENLDPEFIEYAWNWFNETKPLLDELIEKYKSTKKVLIFKNREELKVFLTNLKEN